MAFANFTLSLPTNKDTHPLECEPNNSITHVYKVTREMITNSKM